MKTLIAFYSRRGENYVSGDIKVLKKGNTECVVEMIKEQLADADLFQIDTIEAYSDRYMTCIEEAKAELHAAERPALKADFDPSAYNTIILGYPNWWGHVPMCVLTWIDAHEFSGKTIIPFCTHEGSGMGCTEKDIRTACPTANLKPGIAIHGTNAPHSQKSAEAIVSLTKVLK